MSNARDDETKGLSMTRRSSLCVIATLALHGFATPSADCAGPGEAKDSPPKRILHAWDGVTMWATILNLNYYESPNREIPKPAAKFSKRILEEMVDEEAAAHVDAISYCLFTAFWSDVPASKVTEQSGSPGRRRI